MSDLATRPKRRQITLAQINSDRVHDGPCLADECIVLVMATAVGGTARTLVRCLFTNTVAHVHPSSVR